MQDIMIDFYVNAGYTNSVLCTHQKKNSKK